MENPKTKTVTSPDDENMEELCVHIRESLTNFDTDWPSEQLKLCGDYGVFEWFLPHDVGGQAWSNADIVRGYLRLSCACLTTTFVITQRMGACRRIAACQNEWLKAQLMPDLVRGRTFCTVGISHLTTSRRHLAKPVLRARAVAGGFELDGFSPWVTGANHAETVLVGATLEDGLQILIVVPTDLAGVSTPDPPQLLALNGSHTGQMTLDAAMVDETWLVEGPTENIMQGGSGAATGGLQTSTLAVGLGRSAVQFLQEETGNRSELSEPAENLQTELEQLEHDLIAAASGDSTCTAQDIRTRANSFVLRAAQASLVAAKGSGFVTGHPAGRWCSESLFFLVWSCPQPVMQANLCELAGIID